MKFTIIVVMLAMAFAIEAAPSWAPHGHHSEWSAWGNGLWGDHHNDWHGDNHGDWHGDWNHGAWDDGHWSHGPVHTHGISLAQGPGWDNHHHAPAHHDHHHHHHHAGYVAKTLGAVHTAPLPGHIASVKSINVAAPPAGGHW